MVWQEKHLSVAVDCVDSAHGLTVHNPQGSGMLVAKAAAGALYPTLCLMVLSMSRWLQNLLR